MSKSESLSPNEIVQIALAALHWIDTAGKESLEDQYISEVESDYSEDFVNLWAVVGILQALYQLPGIKLEDYIIAGMAAQCLEEVMQDNFHKSATDLALHPLPVVPLGTLIAVIARDQRSNYIKHKNPGIRAIVAIMSTNEDELNELSLDPCVLVRFSVSNNHCTSEDTLSRLARDEYFHVYRRATKSREPEDLEKGMWPVQCNCLSTTPDLEFFNYFDQKRMFLPYIGTNLEAKLRHFSELNWGTQCQPLPQEDYMLDSVEYLKGVIPDQYVINHWGHGIASYSLNLRIAIFDIALIFQTSWGGLYGDNEQELERWNEMAQWADEIIQERGIEISEDFKQRNFVIVFSDFRIGQAPVLWVRKENQWNLEKDIVSFSDVQRVLRGRSSSEFR